MALAETSVADSDNARDDSPTGEPSMASSLEQVLTSSHAVLTKRIDLALLEGRELLSRAIQGAAILGLGIILAAAAWLAVTASVVLFVIPDAGHVVRLAVFGLVNAGAATGLVTLAMRRSRPPTRVRRNDSGPAPQHSRDHDQPKDGA